MKTVSLALAALAPMLVFAQAETVTETGTETVTSTTSSAESTDSAITTVAAAMPDTTVAPDHMSTSVDLSFHHTDCEAGHTVKSCLGITRDTQLTCKVDDYACHCYAYQAIVGCFQNCPDDPRRTVFIPLLEQYCSFAGLPITRTATSTPTSTTLGRPGHSGNPAEDESSTISIPPTTTNGVAHLVNAAGGLMAAAGLVAALL